MKTKTILLVLLALLFSLVACNAGDTDEGGSEEAVSPTEQPTETPTEAPSTPDELLGMWYWLAYHDTADINNITVSAQRRALRLQARSELGD